jgi:hypothetical protein
MGGLYKGSLKLDRVTGIRHDKGQFMTYVPVKQDTTKLQESPKGMKTTENVTSDGLKK